MILIEIASRSDLNSVSMAAVSEDDNLKPPFGLHFVSSTCLKQERVDGMRMDLMWRPHLPELKAGKADNDCPKEGDYYEVCQQTNVEPYSKLMNLKICQNVWLCVPVSACVFFGAAH